MKLTEDMIKVIADLEYRIGKQCYNPNSYDGWSEIEGCEFRYPINVPVKDENGEYEYIKTRSNIRFEGIKLDSNSANFMKYKFGSNELFIGKGIMYALDYLADRYNLDFNELEEAYQTQQEER